MAQGSPYQTPVAPPTDYQFDYTNQAWVVDGRYVRCGHTTCIIDAHGPVDDWDKFQAQLAQSCFGNRHLGERPHPEAHVA